MHLSIIIDHWIGRRMLLSDIDLRAQGYGGRGPARKPQIQVGP